MSEWIRRAGAQEGLAVAVVVVAGLCLVTPILCHGALPWGSDAAFHAQLANGVVRGHADGIAAPGWISAANRGYGSPALIHYPPLSAHFVAWGVGLGLDLIAAMTATITLAAVASGLALYLCARSFAGPLPAAVAAVLYVLMPYHVLDLYERFALAEFNALVWLPLVVFFARRLAQPSASAWLGFACAYAALTVTHVAIAYIAAFAIAPYALFVALPPGSNDAVLDDTPRSRTPVPFRSPRPGFVRSLGLPSARPLLRVASATAAALALSSVYLLPVLVERDAIRSEHLVASYWGAWQSNFAFRDAAEFGLRSDPIKPLVNAGLLCLLGLIAISVAFLGRPSRRALTEGWLLAALALFATILQLPVSAPLWGVVPGMPMLSFPWRFQVLQLLFAALLAAWVLESRPISVRGTRAGRVAGAVMALAALVYSASLFGSRPFSLDTDAFVRRRVDQHVQPEHLPRGVERWPELAYESDVDFSSRVETHGRGSADILEWTSHRRLVDVHMRLPGAVDLRTFWYPGWRVRLDAAPVEPHPAPHLAAIRVDVGSGEHQIEAEFLDTGVRQLARGISTVTAVVLAIAGARLAIRRRATGSVATDTS